jgi:MFS superfamily sulfate permease-like transporter
MLLLARILRLGFLADFLSRRVLVGFLSGVGIQVALGELPGLLGLEKGGHGVIQQLVLTFQHLPETRLTTSCMALAVLVILVGFEVFASHFPGALLAVIGMTAASAFFHWGEHGVGIVGEVPSGLPRLGLPDVVWKDVPAVLPIAFSCFIVILAQSAATSRAYAQRYRDSFSQNVDLVGLGLANVAVGCSSTFVVNGSPTKTAMVDTGGGRSQMLAVVLSLLQHVHRSYRPHMAVILRDEVDHWRMEQPVPGKMLEPGLVMFWFGADLFYANAASFTAKARQLVEESPSPVRWLIIDASAITGIDFSGASALAELQQDLAKNSVVLALARFQPIAGEKAEEPLERLGLIKLIGPDRIFSSRSACLEAYRTESRTKQNASAPTGGLKDILVAAREQQY